MKKAILIEVITGLIVMMFLYASFSKYFDMPAFIRAMGNQPFPPWFSALLVVVLPPIEIATSMLLVREKTRLLGLKATIILMSLFTAYIVAILVHLFPRIPCSCGGIINLLSWQQHLLFNIFFLFLAVFAWHLNKMPAKQKSSVLIQKDISRAKSG